VTVVSELYRRTLYAGADAFVAYSSNTREHLTERGVASDDIFVGGQVMPEECLSPRPQGNGSSNGEPENTFTITFLGYLQRRKGVQFLIEAYNSLNLPETKLQIAGSGTYQQQLEELAAGNDSIEFLGYVEGTSKARCYIESDLFVLPTLQDPWGFVVNEAIYYDCPVIVTEAAGSADLIREANCGIVIRPGSTRALRQGIQELYHDHDRRKRYVKNTQKVTESTDVDIGIKPFGEAIMTVMNNQSNSSKKSGNSCVQ
jgi:glycosyltransferase involved in cell wall biosynthesis